MRQQIVYKNWPCATPSWTEVILDLVHYYLHLLLLNLAVIMGTPLHDLDSRWEKVVKVAVPFTIIWGLSCWCNPENWRATRGVVSFVTPRAVTDALRSVSVAVGASVSAVTMPFRYVWRLKSRVATETAEHVARAIELGIDSWVLGLIGLSVQCLCLAGCFVVVAVYAIVVNTPTPWDIHVGFRRWRTWAAAEVWCWFHPLPPVQRSVIPLIRRRPTFEEELQKTLGEGKLCLVLPRNIPVVSPQVTVTLPPPPTPPSPMPDYSYLFAYPKTPPPAARPAGEGAIYAPVPQRYKDRSRSKYFRGRRWSPIQLV
ncbi:hypothetical protein TWF281_003100 [Arthrobotrys megalospora]